jgi:hypothetical protein
VIRDFRDYIKEFSPGKTRALPHILLHSFKEPILSQVVDRIPRIEKVTILVPTHSQDPSFVKEAIDLLGGRARFLIDPSRFSVSSDTLKTYENFEAARLDNIENRPLHAKLYILHTEDGDWTLYGSPNFTETALLKSVRNGGNLETACLIPPSDGWSWETLFNKSVSITGVHWNDIPATEPTAEDTKKETIVAKWGYETLAGKGVILSPGLQDGTVVYVYLQGMDDKFEVRVVNRRIIFDIPSSQIEITRFEVFDTFGNMLAQGYLNRTGMTAPFLKEYDIDEGVRQRLWLYLNRLRQRIPHPWDPVEYPDIPIDRPIWRPVLGPLPWTPVSFGTGLANPQDIYHEALDKLDDTLNRLMVSHTSDVNAQLVRHSLNALDLLVEGAFYETCLTRSQSNLVNLAKDLGRFMNLPCESDPLTLMDLKNWRPYFAISLDEPLLDAWNKYAPHFCIGLTILFSYWLYLHRRGTNALQGRSLDALIVTNRYYQVRQAINEIVKNKSAQASVDRVWEDRIEFLQTDREMEIPSNPEQLQAYLETAFESCKRRLVTQSHVPRER